MIRFSTALFPILLAFQFGYVQAGQPGAGSEPEPPPDEGQTGASATELGPLSIGVTNVNENERLKTISGDIELGYLYEHEFDSTFPRVLELRPFLFNRAGTTETAYYQSLGIGAGMGLSLRKKYEENNWFIRLSMLTPNDEYRAQFDLDRNRTAIVDLFAGYEIPIGVTDRGRELRERTTQPGPIQLRVPAGLLHPDLEIDPDKLARIHTLVIGAYLAEVSRLQGAPPWPQAYTRWPVIQLIEQVTGRRLTEMQWWALRGATVMDTEQDTERRRQIVTSVLKRGLTQMMRDAYPLLIKPVNTAVGNTSAGKAGDGVAADRPATVVAFISRPGTRFEPTGRPMDADTMIDHYIASFLSRID